jgi:hypothetical protein
MTPVDPARIDKIIAAAPRRPSSILLGATRRMPEPAGPLPGEVLDHLHGRGLEAVRSMVLTKSATQWMAERKISEGEGLARLLQRSSPELVKHLNTIPDGFRLTVIAAKPASHQEIAGQTAIYEDHRQKYIRLIGSLAGKHLDHFSSVCIRELARRRKDAPPPALLTMGRHEIAMIQAGRLPPGWNVEHRNDRGLSISGEKQKNKVGDLMIMPETHNQWEARLKHLQYGLAFKAGRDSIPRLLFQAEPINGPAQGYFVFGARVPATMKLLKLSRMLETDIRDLNIDGSLPEKPYSPPTEPPRSQRRKKTSYAS